ncbi:MAG: site-specific DNA-methyltransferase [Bacteroidales bacterium]|nr:site-specific DNA-methyltransferase [Bacteroidales bacterium]
MEEKIMIKDIMEANESVTLNEKEIAVLKEIFPSCFRADSSFDMVRFSEYLKDKIEISYEGYELKFLGKSYSKMLASLDTETVIVPDGSHNSLPENANSKNVYISGDNLDGLKHLLKSYARQVKCIYIDPPYNTGSDGFVYNDKFNFSVDDLVTKLSIDEEQAQRILDLTKRGSASHSAWLMFMYPRLQLARDLMNDNGVIFISIDDNEKDNLKLLCDDVFGENNFIACIIVQSNKRGQTYKQLAKTHEYLLVYVKNENVILNELSKGADSFNKEDNIGEFEERELRNRNPKFGRFNRPNLFYPIYANPNKIDACGYCPVSLDKSEDFNIEILPYNSEGGESCWRWGQSKFNNNNNSNSTMNSDVVAKLKTTGEYGCYEKYRKGTYKAKTIWYEDNIVGDLVDEEDDIWEETSVITEQGSKELGVYEMADAFDFPKPTYLVRKVMQIGGDSDSIYVDFFSGSATSTEALMTLNAEDNGTRKIIAIQLPEDLDNKLELAGKTEKPKIQKVIDFLDSIGKRHFLDEVGQERILRASKSIKEKYPDTTADLGFKHYTLKEVSQSTLDKIESFDNSRFITDTTVYDEFGANTVLTTWLVRDGYGFNNEMKMVDFTGYTAYWCCNHLYFINPGMTEDAIKALIDTYNSQGSFNPQNIILFGYSFNYVEMENLKANVKILRDSEKNLKINLDIRY